MAWHASGNAGIAGFPRNKRLIETAVMSFNVDVFHQFAGLPDFSELREPLGARWARDFSLKEEVAGNE